MTKAERQRKQKNNQLIVGLILVFLMIFSTFGYAFYNRADAVDNKVIKYNGVDFKESGYGTWLFKINNLNYETLYNPNELDIRFSLFKSKESYQGKKLYFNAESQVEAQNAQQEIIKNLGYLISGVDLACLNENCEVDKPIKNCSEANIIIFYTDNNLNEPIVTEDKNCVIINSSYSDQERVADVFVFKILELM